MTDAISRDEARTLVGKMLFGDGWISGLTEDEKTLLGGDYGPKKIQVVRPNGMIVAGKWGGWQTIEVFLERCPPDKCRALDIALGRVRRMEIQGRTVDNWIETAARLDLAWESFVDHFGGNIGLVVIDTSAAMFQGDDDNNNIQALAHAKTQRQLCELPGRPCVLPLVHPTKHVASPDQLLPRGGGAYLNEVDGNLTAWAHGERLSRLHWAGKFRGPDFEQIEFRLPTVLTTELTDTKGRMLPTVRAEIATDEAIQEADQRSAFQDMRLLLAIFDRPAGSIAEWAIDCGWTLAPKPGDKPKPYRSLVQRVLKRLVDQGRVKKNGDIHSLTPAGTKAAKEARKTTPVQGRYSSRRQRCLISRCTAQLVHPGTGRYTCPQIAVAQPFPYCTGSTPSPQRQIL